MKNFLIQFFDIKFWKFIAVGVVNTLIGEGLKFLLFLLSVSDEWVSSIIGVIVGSVVSYFLNKYFTFKNTEKGWKPVLRFAVNIAVCFTLANVIALNFFKWIFVSNSVAMFGMSVDKFSGVASMAIGSCLFVAFNYIGQRFFAFKEKSE